jgi:hypothetical protein
VKALWGTFGTWLKAFNGPCLYACLVAAFVGGAAAGYGVKVYKDREVLAERLTTQTFRTDLAQSKTDVLEGAAVLMKAANDNVLARVDAGFKELSGEFALARDANTLARLEAKIEELHNDPQYACRRLPLPDAYLDSLRLPTE